MRRSAWRINLLLLVLVLMVTRCLQPILAQESPNRSKYLEAALKVENWLASVERRGDHGRVFWPNSPDRSDAFSFDLYHGNTGVIGFYLGLFDVTHEKEYLQRSTDGADHLIHEIEQLNSEVPVGLYTGVAGYGQTMIRVWERTKQEKYKQAAIKCVEHIESQAKTKDSYTGDACHFNQVTDVISGSAGIIQFLLDTHESLNSQSALKLAIRCGDGLVSDGIRTKSADNKTEMLHWRMTDHMEREYPNLSHGTAGICGALMKLDEAVNGESRNKNDRYDNRFIVAATQGAQYLNSIAASRENQSLIFHHPPGGEDLYYLGWCHGPPGTSAMLIGLGEKTNDSQLKRRGYLGAKALVECDLSRNRTPGFWNNVGQCCGTAGVAKVMSVMFLRTHDEVYLQECRKLTDDLLKRATTVNLPEKKVGLKWLQAEHRVRPDELQAQTGFMQGAAGIGQWLLDMHELESRIKQ